MRLGRLESSEGQTLAEYSIVVAAIAVGCAMLLLFLSGGVRGLFDTSTKPIQGGFTPPVNGTRFGGPKSVADCEHEGWVVYGYASFEKCKEAVEAAD